MNCAPDDLKDLFFGEIDVRERKRVEEHLAACLACQYEFDRLQLTQTALLSVREEELPRRIAFVSDKVFEPRWYQRLWNSGPKLGFAAAAMLSCAILVHAFVPTQSPNVTTASADPAVVQAMVQSEVNRRVSIEVKKVAAEYESRSEVKLQRAMLEQKKQFEFDRRADMIALEANYTVLQKKMNHFYMASAELPGGGQ